jgi:hypothetical protein
MAGLSQPTDGAPVSILRRPLQFSFWRMYKGTRRFGLQSNLFAVDPWTIIRDKIRTSCPRSSQPEAIACLEQSSDFFKSSEIATITAARPLQLYYCFMNLAKALVLTRGTTPTFDKAKHGLSEQLAPGGKELKDAYLEAYSSPHSSGVPQVFGELYRLILGHDHPKSSKYSLSALLPQILPGHRLWANAVGKPERFISVNELRFMENQETKNLWINIFMVQDDLNRLAVTHRQFLAESRLTPMFHEVKCSQAFEGRSLICFEQTSKAKFSHRPSDMVQGVVDHLKQNIWVTVNSSQPYRRYYVYLAPVAEQSEVLPQLLSIYAVTYYLGSITRYRPQLFDSLLNGPFGPLIEEFIGAQPMQFIYSMASEFAQQDITKPALI